MHVTISASGKRDQALINAADQCKKAAAAHEGTWPALATLRDYIGTQVKDAGPEDDVTISASVSVTISVSKAVATPAETSAPAPAFRYPQAKAATDK